MLDMRAFPDGAIPVTATAEIGNRRAEKKNPD
jgi:hypothetical protein